MEIRNKQILYIFLIFSILISLSHVLIDNFYHSVSSEEIILSNAKQISLKKEKLLKDFLSRSKRIIISTKESKSFNDFINNNSNKNNVTDLFLTLMNSNDDFMKFRYIDENGQEIIKVEKENRLSKAKIVETSSLQNKSQRYYFNESKYLGNNEVWFSSIELNIENGKTQIPYKPIIRAVLAIYSNNKYKGIIVVNYFANNIIKELVYAPMFKITLADELGFIISSYDKSKNWGFEKNEKFNIAMEYKKDFNNILTKDLFINKNLFSRAFNLELFDNIFIIFEVNEKFLAEQKETKLIQEIFLSLMYLFISLCLSLIIMKIIKKIYIDFNKQKHIVDRLELASNIANIAIWELDATTHTVIWTKNIHSILKIHYNPTYSAFLNMIPKKDKRRFNTEFYNSIKEKREFSISHEITLIDNTKKILQEKGKHFYDNQGFHIKSIGSTYDITEKYQADELKDKIIKQNKDFEKLFNKFDENVIASTANLKGIITYTSKAFCEISGYSENELLNSSQNIVRHPDSSSDKFKQLWDTIQSGQIWQGEIKNKNKNGSYYWVYAIIYPEYTQDNKVYAYTAIRKDITAQKKIEELNKNIKSSIEVASFIQESLLPTEAFVDSCFSDKFIIWEPKDIVGGDIYFLEKLRNEDECLLMVIDCTGHGVPGAFVSMLIKAIEKQIIQKLMNKPEVEISPGKILQYFNKELKEILNQKQRNLASNVGFDGGIIYYNKKEKILTYAGAANTLIYYDKNETKMIKGDRHSIGYKNSDINYEFKNHEIKVEKGMKFYLFSDGYIDQIGGKKNQSFSRARTIKILNKNKDRSMSNQKEVLLSELKDYQKDIEQVDDITFLAVEI